MEMLVCTQSIRSQKSTLGLQLAVLEDEEEDDASEEMYCIRR
jgi:hypothetical protein